MSFRLRSLFAITFAASAAVVSSMTAATSATATPSFPCTFVRNYHASNCIQSSGSGNLVVNNAGQIANTGVNTGAVYICPIPQHGMDTNPATWPLKTVQIDGYANSVGVTVRLCVTPAGGGNDYCVPVLEQAQNGVFHKTIDGSTLDGFDYMFLRVNIAGTSNGSSNTIFGYSITTHGNEHSSC